MITTQELIDEVLSQADGVLEAAVAALEDGEYLSTLDVDQDTVEEAWNALSEQAETPFSLGGLEYKQHAFITATVQDESFDLVVVRLGKAFALALREQKKYVKVLDSDLIDGFGGDCVLAAKAALQAMVALHGEARVRAVLASV